MKIVGGFFWHQDEPVIELGAGEHTVHDCVVFSRPRWWEIRRWYRALRLWLSLPHTKADAVASAIRWSE